MTETTTTLDIVARCRAHAPHLAWNAPPDGSEAAALVGPLAVTVGSVPSRGGYYAQAEDYAEDVQVRVLRYGATPESALDGLRQVFVLGADGLTGAK